MFAGLGKLGSETIIKEAIKELVTKKLYDKLKQDHPDFTFDYSNLPPKDLSNLFKATDKLNFIPDLKMHFVGIYWSCYEITKEGKIITLQNQVDKLTDNYRFFASTAAELQKLSLVKSLCESLNSFLKDPEIIPEKIFTTVYFDQEAKRFAPSGSYVKYNLNPTTIFNR
jgi:hypothetical protein